MMLSSGWQKWQNLCGNRGSDPCNHSARFAVWASHPKMRGKKINGHEQAPELVMSFVVFWGAKRPEDFRGGMS